MDPLVNKKEPLFCKTNAECFAGDGPLLGKSKFVFSGVGTKITLFDLGQKIYGHRVT